MADRIVLILDDDEMWLARHERRLRQADISCLSTQFAKTAIDMAKQNHSIKIGLVDEILYQPPIPLEESKRELQRWQGSGVVREIMGHRSDMQFVMVTSAPQLISGGDVSILTIEVAKLRRQLGVVDVIHKQDIERDPDREYGWLIGLINDVFKRTKSSATGQVDTPRVLIGLGFDKEIYELMIKQQAEIRADERGVLDQKMRRAMPQWLPASAFIQIGQDGFKQLLERANDKVIFVEMPGSKKRDRCSSIKGDSSEFRILMLLALRATIGKEVLIRDEDYEYSPRKSCKKTQGTLHLNSGIVPAENADSNSIFDEELAHITRQFDFSVRNDIAFEYNETGRKGARKGMKIERLSQSESALKVGISRLKDKLVGLNLGLPRRQLFSNEGGAYRPSFKIGLVFYPSNPAPSQRR